VCKHGWPNAGLRKTRYVVLGMLVHQYHFYLFIFINYLFTKKKRTMHYLVLLSIFFFKYLIKHHKTHLNNILISKQKPSLIIKKKGTLFFHKYLWKKKWLISIFSSKETDDTRFGHSNYRNCVLRLFSVIHLFTSILFVLSQSQEDQTIMTSFFSK